ncbi:MAG TPA: hypothetical protein VFW90_01210, partial [Candidatus Saccharimonadales bacterium]|nr:hypothetical protein [Candidatus Saccharimonadales bacterium]
QADVGGGNAELRLAALREVEDVLGIQLAWLIRHGLDAEHFDSSYEELVSKHRWDELMNGEGLSNEEVNELASKKQLDYLNGEKIGRRIRAILGDSISNVIDVENSEADATVGDFEKAKNALLAQLRQARNTAKQQKSELAASWKSILERAEQEDPIIAMRHILSLLTNNPEYSLHPTGAVAEWVGHMNGLASRVRDAQTTTASRRSLTIRYLDGKDDFSELLRFADGAQCCFTSEDTGDGAGDYGGEWRMRINRDPHWFVFNLEDTPPDAEVRISSGFIFGSLARVDGQPTLAINGVYMQKKTDTAANSILDEVVERFAKPLGISQVMVATTYGGRFEPDKSKWHPAGGRTLHRPRAIRNDYDDEPESEIYDDLGNVVNENAPVPEYCWIKTI